jgi:hypothetical protein
VAICAGTFCGLVLAGCSSTKELKLSVLYKGNSGIKDVAIFSNGLAARFGDLEKNSGIRSGCSFESDEWPNKIAVSWLTAEGKNHWQEFLLRGYLTSTSTVNNLLIVIGDQGESEVHQSTGQIKPRKKGIEVPDGIEK